MMIFKELFDGFCDFKFVDLVKNKIVFIGIDVVEVGYEDMYLIFYNKEIFGVIIYVYMIS